MEVLGGVAVETVGGMDAGAGAFAVPEFSGGTHENAAPISAIRTSPRNRNIHLLVEINLQRDNIVIFLTLDTLKHFFRNVVGNLVN